MSKSNSQDRLENPNESVITWSDFIADIPPSSERKVSNICRVSGLHTNGLVVPTIEIYCDSEICQDIRFFDSNSSFDDINLNLDIWVDFFLYYMCRHCRITRKTYAISVKKEENSDEVGVARKIGQWPSFSPHISSKVITLIRDDKDLFFKGRRAEAQGLGIGAFAYYRRVITNQKNRLIDEIIKVFNRLGYDKDNIKQLELAKKETQFSKAVEIIKDGIPEVLKIEGHNPLTLLHDALSGGLHDMTDEKCLVCAQDIRNVLVKFTELLNQALKDDVELKSSVHRLMNDKGPNTQ